MPRMSLIEQLVTSFGLSEQQANGAIGAIGRAAKDKLAPDLFAELGKVIPGLDGMVADAPKAGGGMLGMLGGSLGQLAQLAGVFKSLGIEQNRIAPIAQAILGFIRGNGSPALVAAVNQLAAKLVV